MEREAIIKALEKTHDIRQQPPNLLGVSFRALLRLIKKPGIEWPACLDAQLRNQAPGQTSAASDIRGPHSITEQRGRGRSDFDNFRLIRVSIYSGDALRQIVTK